MRRVNCQGSKHADLCAPPAVGCASATTNGTRQLGIDVRTC